MEAILNYFTLFYSTPIVLYSIPFTIFTLMLLLSIIGLPFDFTLDGEADFNSSIIQGFFTHFKATKIPFTLFMVLFFMFGSVFTTIFAEYITSNAIFVSIFMFAIIYPVLWLSVIPLASLHRLLDNSIQHDQIEYIGSTVLVSSVSVKEHFGYGVFTQNGVENQIDIFTDIEGIVRGDEVLVVSYDSVKNSYYVQKIEGGE